MVDRPQSKQGGNGPLSIEHEIGQLARSVERGEQVPTKEHPALVACKKAAEMVRGVHERHSAEGETLAQHLEQIGQDFMQMCKDAADKIREQRILPKEMAEKIADDLLHIGQTESARQATVARGLTDARDAILGIDQTPKQG